MTVSIRRQWQHFMATPSGQRFQTRHRMRRAQGAGLSKKILITLLGLVVIIAGIAMLVLPGPGILAIVAGAALIAEESLLAARVLDRLDVWVTRHYEAWRKRRSDRK